jgi:glycosyltransferase involved in cell wall biosynthesis
MQNNVTVVIPTRNRPEMVVRAVESALEQTYPVHQVIVVVDGPDDATVTAIHGLADSRVVCLALPVNGGGNHARNLGAAKATTEWVAFLDDDDEWLPEKIERQFQVAEGYDIVSCRFIVKNDKGNSIRPKRLPGPEDKFGDYLFARRSIFNGEAAVITSTLMVRKELIDRIALSTTLRRHQEADWVIRTTELGARIVYAPEALLIFNDDSGRIRISTSYNWRQSLEWIRNMRSSMGRRAYAGFVLASLGAAAAGERDWSAFTFLLREAFEKGSPTLLHLALYFGMWMFPQNLRQRMRFLLSPAQPARG